MKYWLIGLALVLFGFICWVIYEANTNSNHPMFVFIRQMKHLDKVLHFLLYGGLTFLIHLAVNRRFFKIPTSILLVGSFALIEEITQIWIDSRNFDFLDLTADVLGIVCFVLIANWVKRRSKTRPAS